jgi:hypothetical protein
LQNIDLPRSSTQPCTSAYIVGDILGDTITLNFSK